MRKREILTPDLTPLIDVVFILLIFFIVSSVFKKNELALVVNLPSSSAQEVTLKPKELIIELNENDLAYMGKKLSLIELKDKIKEIKDTQKNIIFKIDKVVKYEKVVKILDILQEHKLYNISLITQKSK